MGDDVLLQKSVVTLAISGPPLLRLWSMSHNYFPLQ